MAVVSGLFCSLLSTVPVHAIEQPQIEQIDPEETWSISVGEYAKIANKKGIIQGIPVEFEYVVRPVEGVVEVDENGILHATKAGLFWVLYEERPTKDSLKRLGDAGIDWIQIDVQPIGWLYVTNTEFVYRLYNPNSGEHLYTTDRNERSYLKGIGWKSEGYGWETANNGDVPVYRLYQPGGEHLYTTDKNEYDILSTIGWNGEGIAWNASSQDTLPVYRLYNLRSLKAKHHLTANEKEKDYLVSIGWAYEGIAWNAPVPLRSEYPIDPIDPIDLEVQ